MIQQKFCKNCGCELKEGAAICLNCGVAVGVGNKFCPNCAAQHDPLAIVCVSCGYDLNTNQNTTQKNNSSGNQNEFLLSTNKVVYTMSEAVKTCFQKYSTFNGRASRTEFWYFWLFNMLISLGFLILILICEAIFWYSDIVSTLLYILYMIYGLVILCPSMAVFVRRLHDTGKSGWYFFISLIPLVGIILLYAKLATAGDILPNKWGNNPKLIQS